MQFIIIVFDKLKLPFNRFNLLQQHLIRFFLRAHLDCRPYYVVDILSILHLLVHQLLPLLLLLLVSLLRHLLFLLDFHKHGRILSPLFLVDIVHNFEVGVVPGELRVKFVVHVVFFVFRDMELV